MDRSERFVYGNKAFRWTAAGGFENLAPLAGDFSATTSDMSEDGKIVVGVSRGSSNFMMAVLWDSTGAVQSLGTLPTDPRLTAYSGASGVSADGSIVVGDSTSGFGSEAFLWTVSGGMVGLGVLPGAAALASGANGISADGSTVVGMSFSQSFPTSGEAMLWTAEGGMRGLGVLRDSDVSSSSLFTSADGAIVFGSSHGFEDDRAFVWDARFGMRDFRGVLETEYDLADDLAGWSDIVPRDVSDSSLVIVGSGINPDGNLEAWAVTLDRPLNVPEPYGVSLIVVVLVLTKAAQKSLGSHP